MSKQAIDSNPYELGYPPALDGLRGIAILAVVAFNGQLLWMGGGFVGVDIFFVLSGFLITSILVQGFNRTNRIAIKEFYFRRALRLLPALIALILACSAFALLITLDRPVLKLRGIFYTLFYVANWAQVPPRPPGLGLLSHAWSLSVEEQFYIVWPLCLLVLLKLKSRALVIAILVSLTSISILMNLWFWQADVPYLRMYFGSDTRANEILIGCITALLLSWGVVKRTDRLKVILHSTSLVSVAGILISFFVVRYDAAFVYNGGFALISIGAAILILDLLLFPSYLSRVFEFAPLVWIGKISYGLYLWHFPIFEASKRLFEGRMNPLVYEITGVALSFLVATASFYWIEQPFLKLRDRFAPTSAATPLVSSASRATVRG